MSRYYNHKRQRDNDQQSELFAPLLSLRDQTQEFLSEWNGKIWLPKLKVTPRQVALIRDAMSRPFFRDHWREAFPIMAKSPFLWSKMRPKITVDWFLISDNFDKVLEGKYLDETPNDSNVIIQTEVNADGDEIILPPKLKRNE